MGYTQRPEDFALQILDGITQATSEDGGKKTSLTVHQQLMAAQAYATVGLAQNTLKAPEPVENTEDDFDRDDIAFALEDAPFAPPGYERITYKVGDSTAQYWIDPEARYGDIVKAIKSIASRKTVEKKMSPEIPRPMALEQQDGPQPYRNVPVGPVGREIIKHSQIETDKHMRESVEKSYPSQAEKSYGEVHDKEPTKVLPQSLRSKIEEAIKAKEESVA